jgi:hypothetical protein
MRIRFHPHAVERMQERGAEPEMVEATLRHGERFPAKFGRTGFRRNFAAEGTWRGRPFVAVQIEAYAVEENGDWLVITVIVRYIRQEGQDGRR